MKKLKLINLESFVLIILFICLFLNFYSNIFRVCDSTFYESFQNDSDAYVYGSILHYSYGENSDGGFLGRYNDSAEKYNHYLINKDTFINEDDIITTEYTTYTGSLGLQGSFYKTLYIIFSFMPNKQIYNIFIIVTVLLVSTAMLLIVYWVVREFGLKVGFISAVSIISMPWLTAIGKSTFWFYWSDYLPFISVLYYLWNVERKGKKYNNLILNSLIFISVFISISFGYEFITTLLIAMVTPIFYYSFKQEWHIWTTLKRLALIVITSISSFVFSIFILYIKIGNFYNDTAEISIDVIINRIAKRTGFLQQLTYVEPVYQRSLNTPVSDVIRKYLLEGSYGIIWDANALDVIIVFIIGIISYFIIKKINKNMYIIHLHKKIESLIIMASVSLLAPFSWLILAKGHSAIHLHLNYIVWSAPFAILVSVFIGIIFIGIVKYERT